MDAIRQPSWREKVNTFYTTTLAGLDVSAYGTHMNTFSRKWAQLCCSSPQGDPKGFGPNLIWARFKYTNQRPKMAAVI